MYPDRWIHGVQICMIYIYICTSYILRIWRVQCFNPFNTHDGQDLPQKKQSAFFPADVHLGGGVWVWPSMIPWNSLTWPFFVNGAQGFGMWGCKRSPLGAWWWVHMGDKFTSQTLGEGVIPDIPADLSGTCGSSWRTFLGCCCYHILAERYSQGKLEEIRARNWGRWPINKDIPIISYRYSLYIDVFTFIFI